MPDNKIHILFFGGEPLLFYKNIIIPTVEYCNNIYTNNFKYDITTNGTLLTKEIVDFLE
jgi:sulfatase maturation enzyme AslB (radical SAM superfamily)